MACAGYVAGGNCLFFGDRHKGEEFKSENIKEDIEKRLAFSEDVGAKYASMLAFPMWEAQLHESNSSIDTVMSVSGRLLPWEVTGTNSAGLHHSFPGGEKAFHDYSQLLGLRAIHFGEDLRAAENQDFISQVGNKTPRRSPGPSFARHSCALGKQTPPTRTPPQTVAVVVCTHAGLDEQFAVLPWPAPQVRPLLGLVLQPHAGPGPLWQRRHPGRAFRIQLKPLASCIPPPSPPPLAPTSTRHRGGEGGGVSPHHFASGVASSRTSVGQDARWRRGESVSLRSARDNMASLELVAHARMAYGSKD